MSEHDNDNLERFFQKAAREPEIEFNEDDWRKLEVKLDTEAARLSSSRPNRLRLGVISAGAILILTGIIYFSVYDQNKPNGLSDDFTVNAVSKDKTTIIIQDTLSKQKEDADAAQKSQMQPTKKGQSLAENKSNLFPINIKKNTNALVGLQNETRVSQKILVAPELPDSNENSYTTIKNSNNKSSSDNSYREVPPKKETEVGKSLLTPNEAQVIEAIDNGVTQSAIGGKIEEEIAVPFSSRADSVDLLLAKKDKLVIEPSKISSRADSVLKSREEVLPSRWSLVLSFAPDFSSTGLSQYTSPGEAFGLMTHYHFNNTLSVSAGIIKSNKKYWGYGSEYSPPVGYWKENTNGIVPKKIQGTCSMLEIPLMLQYKVVKMKISRLFIAAGVSSYIILNESYRYTFDSPNPGATNGWGSSKTSRSLFSIANVSVGYERDISHHLAIGIEPYIKIPVSGIGWSEIKLFSAGASLTLRYNLLKKEKYPPPPAQSRGPD